jgi:DMSO reductase anchor subunit
MHPAYSVILFTTASGAGYGLLALTCLGGVSGLIAPQRAFGIIALGLAIGLITLGLLSSTVHLGHPERAWRAFSQWRSSWLSREGLAAVATYPVAGLAAFGWIVLERTDGIFAAALVATALLALATVACTGQIYASLKTIPAWHQPLTTPSYLALALATGAILLHGLLRVFGQDAADWSWFAVLTTLLALSLKLVYWANIDQRRRSWTIGAATGLGDLGQVRPLDPPHTQPNFVMREMGYGVARKHAGRLRLIASLSLFYLPLLLCLVALVMPPAGAVVVAALAIFSAGVGVVIERWLFFAEAEHVAMLYYGRPAI